MLNKLQSFLKEHSMTQPGDTMICAVSGGADSMALLWGMYLLREKLGIRLEAAHFNHGLRGAESDEDEAFVRAFCEGFEIPLHVGAGRVIAGEKGLEAAARSARYEFLESLPGKIATAHTADDNAETVLMHLIRGTGLKGLGGITPVRGKLVRPMLDITREEVLAFLLEEHISYRTDSSNAENIFFRNRLRHQLMPLLKEENPGIAGQMSQMALRLRQDEAYLCEKARQAHTLKVQELAQMPEALRCRVLEHFLKEAGIREPEASHIALAKSLVFSVNPSAWVDLPGGIRVGRCYDRLTVLEASEPIRPMKLNCPGETVIEPLGLRILCIPASKGILPQGTLLLRSRQGGDEITLPGGTKSLKKLFIDRKIPASQRAGIPVIADDRGVLAAQGFGMNLRFLQENGFEIRFEQMTDKERK